MYVKLNAIGLRISVILLANTVDDICVQANKMSEEEGPLFEAAQDGDVEASIAVIRATEQL